MIGPRVIRSRTIGAGVALALLATTLCASGAPADAWMSAPLACDFDANGYSDIAVAARLEGASDHKSAGVVQITYVTKDWWLTQTITMGFVDKEVTDQAYFGSALACGDFNDDAFADLAISATGRYDSAGAVYVLYGAAGGLGSDHTKPTQQWHQDNVGTDKREKGDQFGFALVAGDFNGDVADDLAIGVPGEQVDAPGGSYVSAGMVHVLPGSENGLTASGAVTRIGECCWAAGRYYGWSLASGDVDRDHRDELAIGMPGATIQGTGGNQFQAGAVEVLQGSSTALLVAPVWAPEVITQQHVGDGPEAYDFFGGSVAMADFDGDGDDDIAIGAAKESDKGIGAAGSVDVVVSVGGLAGFDFDESYRITQDTGSMPDASEVGDQFGTALATGDFDGDGNEDLAIGTRESGGATQQEMGSFYVLPGTATTLDTVAATMTAWNGEEGAWLGATLATGDITGDGREDLVVGMPGASVKGLIGAGAVLVFEGQHAAAVIDIQPVHVTQVDEAVAKASPPNPAAAGERFGTGIGN